MRRAALAIVIFAATSASAHDLGISRTDLTERENGSFHGRFTFAAKEAASAFDRDGHVAIDVKADGASCAAGPATSTADGDGVIVDEDFTCDARAMASVGATLYFVTDMSGAHEDVARIETPDGAHEELLRAPHRTILLELHRGRAKGAAESPHRRDLIVLAIALVALIALAIRSILKRRS